MPDYTSFVDSYTAWATERMGIYATAYKSTLAKVAANSYGAHDLTNDIAAAFLRMTEDVATLMSKAANVGRPPGAPAEPPAGGGGGGNQ
jgi:hypothetical protein